MPTASFAITEAPDVAAFAGTVTPHITDVQSYSWVIRNVFYDALMSDPFFAGYFGRKTNMVPVQVSQLPFLGVYIISETQTSDGDANAGDIRFGHTLLLGFSVMIAMNDQVAAEKYIDAAYWRINNRLWRDPKIMGLYYPTNPDTTRIESITRGVRRPKFGATSINNQTPLAELQYDVSVFFRTMWDPVITDTLDEIDVTTGVKSDDTPDAMRQRRQIHAKYDFTGAAPSRFSKFRDSVKSLQAKG